MKKKIIYLIVFVITVFFIIFVVGNLQRESLQPDVADAITKSLVIDESAMEQNAYVALMGIEAPTEDYIAVGKSVIINNVKKIKTAIKRQDDELMSKPDDIRQYVKDGKLLKTYYDVAGVRYIFPCSKLTDFDCVNKILRDKDKVNQLIKDNKLLLDRYKHIISMAHYNAYPMTPMSPMPPFMVLMQLSNLQAAEAIFLIDEGKVIEGFQLLSNEIKFYKKMLTGRIVLIDNVIALNRLSVLYHVTSSLLDRPELVGYLNNNLVTSLVTPLASEQQTLTRAFEMERNYLIYFYLTISGNDATTLNMLLYDRNATANKAYLQFERIIKLAQLTSPKVSDLAIEDKQDKVLFKRLIKEKGLFFLRNLYGEYLLDDTSIDTLYLNYLKRLYDLVTYLHLIHTKLQIKQAGLDKSEVANWLVKHKVVNAYTGKPVEWDEIKQQLMSDWLQEVKSYNEDKMGKRPTVYIEL